MRGRRGRDLVVHGEMGGTDGGSAECDVGAEALKVRRGGDRLCPLLFLLLHGFKVVVPSTTISSQSSLTAPLISNIVDHPSVSVGDTAKSSWPTRTDIADSIDADF